jgi:NhaA family Na+:H+ antiporter
MHLNSGKIALAVRPSRPMSATASPHPFVRFFAHESVGGVVLAIAALAALIVSNSVLAGWYNNFLSTPGAIVFGKLLVLEKTLLVWINDLLMAVFFFLVGLEIKREFVEGELATRAQAMLPAAAALGGMAVPAAIYAAINWGDAAALRGWAIASATDIAFAIGVLMLLGSRVPAALKVFLTAVAIIDDLGAIVVIAIFYTEHLSAAALGGAAGGVAVLALLNRAGVTRIGPYVMVGLVVWVFVLKSGVHATLAGVITALAVPMRDARGESPLQRAEDALHPWVAFAILPLFAFANAGVDLAGTTLATLMQPVTLGIAAGLTFGKVIGVYGASWFMIRSGLAAAPAGASSAQFIGVAALCGIGFTMSLFIGGLAFAGFDPSFESRLKLGVLGGSLASAVVGVAILLWAARPAKQQGNRAATGVAQAATPERHLH